MVTVNCPLSTVPLHWSVRTTPGYNDTKAVPFLRVRVYFVPVNLFQKIKNKSPAVVSQNSPCFFASRCKRDRQSLVAVVCTHNSLSSALTTACDNSLSPAHTTACRLHSLQPVPLPLMRTGLGTNTGLICYKSVTDRFVCSTALQVGEQISRI